MSAYISHTLIAREVYEKIGNKDDIDKDYMITFSLGWDLSKFSKCRRDTHKIKQDLFFSNMIDYIKENNLVNDKKIMGVLYGHICHYITDEVIHPLVRCVDRNTVSPGIKKHTVIEAYYDSYMVGEDNFCIYNKKLLKGKVNKDIEKMLNYVYMETYGVKNISRYYKGNLLLQRLTCLLYGIIGYRTFSRIFKFKKYFNINRDIDLVNSNHKFVFNNKYKKEECLSLEELFNKSIQDSIKYLNSLKFDD